MKTIKRITKIKINKTNNKSINKIIKNKKKIKVVSNKKKEKVKKKNIQLEEVAKHNKKSDAWIVINNKVANITEWIPKHPGGDIIMKGVGKDATELFNNIGHSNYAKKC